VQEIRREAHLFGVFILPSGGELDLEYLDLLEGYAVVDHATLSEKNARAAAATKIVNDTSDRSDRIPPSIRGDRVTLPPSVRA
jgi:hypothetical protein